ncbi:MAG: BaiN/RdsA family NAD(P)/FAD-dependent oxidoreductase [Thermoplasmatota archaeon]
MLGGGAAGFFGALAAAEADPTARVVLLEAASRPLQKVKISGGGRCNVTTSVTRPGELVKSYPRGANELRGVFARWGPRETVDWFESRGVRLKTEPDGRVFPESDDSQSILDALEAEARRRGVEVRCSTHTTHLLPLADGRFEARIRSGEPLVADAVLLATGSSPSGLRLAAALGHKLVPPVPSLFTFVVKDPRLDGLAGVAVEKTRLRLKVGAEEFEHWGPLLVTHWGVSGPGVLKLSAWGARALAASAYRGTLAVDFAPDVKEPELRARAAANREEHPRGTIAAHPLTDAIPRRLWEHLLRHASVDAETRWNELPSKALHELVRAVKASTFEVTGKGEFKEEFVTAGGVALGEVDFRTMESRVRPGLYFAGEILDVDALTGGFNLQNAWSTGWVAGRAMAARVTR